MRLTLSSCADITSALSICEGTEISLKNKAEDSAHNTDDQALLSRHAHEREASEHYYFNSRVQNSNDDAPVLSIPKGKINEADVIEKAVAAAPDIIACYGSSILKQPWFDAFPEKILNLHLGLSPYYRGSGTNFWAMAHGRFECIGATFMVMDQGIDTGNILHQMRAAVEVADTPHDIGNRLIFDAALSYANIIKAYAKGLKPPKEPASFEGVEGTLCKRADYTPEKLRHFYADYDSLKRDYLAIKQERIQNTPIVEGL